MLSSSMYYNDVMKAIYARLYVLVSKELLMPQKVSWLLNLNISLKGDIKTRVTSQNKCHRIKDRQVVLLRGYISYLLKNIPYFPVKRDDFS